MTNLDSWKMASAVCLLCAATAIAASAQIFETLVDFNGGNGLEPLSLVQGADGDLYGTTIDGGDYDGCKPGCGTVFKVSREGVLTTLYFFCAYPGCYDGDLPFAGLVLATDGNFYGTTFGGWNFYDDTVFRVTPQGTLTTLHVFTGPEGYGPEAGLVQAVDNSFYGTTINGGNSTCDSFGCGTVFSITMQGKLTTVYRFCAQTGCPDGAMPYAALMQARDGNFYGTTS